MTRKEHLEHCVPRSIGQVGRLLGSVGVIRIKQILVPHATTISCDIGRLSMCPLNQLVKRKIAHFVQGFLQCLDIALRQEAGISLPISFHNPLGFINHPEREGAIAAKR